MLEIPYANTPLIPECVKCGNNNKSDLQADHIWLLSMLGKGRKMAEGLDLSDLQDVIRMRENKSYLCSNTHADLDRLKEARFFGRNVCDKEKCPIINPKVRGLEIACTSRQFCNTTDDELADLRGSLGERPLDNLDLSNPATRGNPKALATFIKESVPLSQNEKYELLHIDAFIRLQTSYVEAVWRMMGKQTGLSDNLMNGYVDSVPVVSDHLHELQERRIPLLEKRKKQKTSTTFYLPVMPKKSRFAHA